MIVAPIVVLAGIYLAYLFWMPGRRLGGGLRGAAGSRRVESFALAGWGFDRLYDLGSSCGRSCGWRAGMARGDLVEPVVAAIAWLNVRAWRALSATQAGAATTWRRAAFGVVVFVAVGLLR